MTSKQGKTGGPSARDDRQARLKAALKANMGKRKAQSRARKDSTPGQAGDKQAD